MIVLALRRRQVFSGEHYDLDDYEVLDVRDYDVELESRALTKASAKAPAKAPAKAAPVAPAKAPVVPAKAPAKAPAPPAKAPPKAPANKCVPNKFKGKRDMFAEYEELFKRDSAEFVGWHGTNSVCTFRSTSLPNDLLMQICRRIPLPSGRRGASLRSRRRLAVSSTSLDSVLPPLRAPAAQTPRTVLGYTSPMTKPC